MSEGKIRQGKARFEELMRDRCDQEDLPAPEFAWAREDQLNFPVRISAIVRIPRKALEDYRDGSELSAIVRNLVRERDVGPEFEDLEDERF